MPDGDTDNNGNEVWMNETEAAKFLGFSPRTLRTWRYKRKAAVERGEPVEVGFGPPPHFVNGTRVRYLFGELVAFKAGEDASHQASFRGRWERAAWDGAAWVGGF